MDPKQITNLAKLLKNNGDKVLNAEYQLSLSGPLLRALNDSFSLIVDQNEVVSPKAFQVTKNYNAKSDVFRDLQFIYDFVQKTIFLSLNLFMHDEPCDLIDISKFRNLRKIEVNRIAIDKVHGLKVLRPQMCEVYCIRSLSCIEDILVDCGGDRSEGRLWNELKVADFSYNGLTKIDNAFEFTPMLQHLNLSNNRLVSVTAVKWLPNLKSLNLNFNRLTEVPLLHADTCRRLQVLLIANNYVEDLMGVACMDGLCELDLSMNCLLDHSTLLPISTLAALQYLNLKGNPMSCHPKHRQVASAYLHKNTSSGVLLLDGTQLSKSEKALTGNYASHRPKVMSQFQSNRSSMSSICSRATNDNTPRSSVGSHSSLVIEHLANRSHGDDMNASLVQRKRPFRHITLKGDTPDEAAVEKQKTVVRNPSTEHLLTKKTIEEQAQKHGANWLKSRNKVGSVLGFKNLSPEKSPSVFGTSPSGLSIVNRAHDNFDVSVVTSTPKDRDITSNFSLEVSSPVGDVTTTTEYKSVLATTDGSATTDYLSVNESPTTRNRQYSIFETIKNIQEAPEVASDPEDNEKTYIVTEIDSAGKNLNEYILVISDKSLKEKNTETGRTQTRWSLETLESCESMRSNTITLYFDTIRRDRKERTYRMSSPLEAKQLLNFLRNILSERDLAEMNQQVYNCAKCSVQFSREVKPNMDPSCPECKSQFVIAMPTATVTKPAAEPVAGVSREQRDSPKRGMAKLWKSASHASIESAGSINDSQSSCSKISQSESSFDSNQSVAGSSDNSDRDKDIADLLRRGDGTESDDIEILSNPSQSSIEVLDTYYSNRKLSDERHILQRPSLETIDDEQQQIANLSTTLTNRETSTSDLNLSALNREIAEMAKSGEKIDPVEGATKEDKKDKVHKKSGISGGLLLTESSSSGSVTDSVCTAYEQNQMVKSDGSDAATPKKDEAKHTNGKAENVSVITTMLGGLFQSTNLLMAKTPKTPSKPDLLMAGQPEPYRYSFTDFTAVDHRLKLFFFQSVFEDDGELMNWLVRGRLVDETQAIASNTGFDGFLLVSSTKFYVFQMVDKESDDPAQWLKKHTWGTIDRLCILKVLPWKMGLTLTIKSFGVIHLLLPDISRTDSLLLFLADNPLPHTCRLDYQVSDTANQKLQALTSQKQIKSLTIFNECRISAYEQHQINDSGCLCVTDTDLFLLQLDTNWLNDTINAPITVTNRQEMANLIEAEVVDAVTFKLNFLNESEDRYEMWKVTFDATETAEATIQTISNWWEKIFGVPLIGGHHVMMETSGVAVS